MLGAGRRGGLKKKTDSKRDRRPGVVNNVRVMHLVDGQELNLQVQVGTVVIISCS